MILGGQHSADLELRSSGPPTPSRIDPPDAIHPEVGVQTELVGEAEQLMLAARDHLAYADSGQVGGGQRGDPELRAAKDAAGQRLVQPLAGPPDRIPFRHEQYCPARARPCLMIRPSSSLARRRS